MRVCTPIAAGMLLAVALGVPPGAALAAEEPGVFGFQWENDAFQFGDNHYTNGLRFAYVPRTDQVPWLHAQAKNCGRRSEHAGPGGASIPRQRESARHER